MENNYPYRSGNRFQTPERGGQIVNPYDQDSHLFQDLQQRGLEPVQVITINLGTAGSLSVNATGFHFVQWGHNGSAIKSVNTQSFVEVLINKLQADGSTNLFPAKHARGFSGPFNGLYLQWPAQAGVFCDFCVFKGAEKPWIDGESAT